MPDLVFLDILPRFDWAQQEAGLRKLTGMYDNAAKKISGMFGAEIRDAAKASTDRIAADVANMQKEVNRATTQATEDFRKLTRANADLEIQTRRLDEITAKYGETSSQATRALYAQSEAQTRLAQSTDAYAASLARETEAASAATAAQAKHAAAVDGAVGKTAVLGNAMNTAGMLAAGATVVVAAASGKMAADFQSSQERLVTTAGETQQALGTVSKGLLDMAGQVGYSSEQLSKGMYTVESAGYHGADGLKVMKAAAQAAKAENADLTDVTNAVTTALHDYHMPADAAADVTSKMITAVSQGKTTFQGFSEALHSVQPLAAAAHISINDLYASLAQMTASGMSADQASQNMADAIRHLQNPTSQMRAELDQLGLDSRNLQEHLGERGLAGSMDLISRTILEKMGPSGKVMLDSLNQSKLAADDAGKMLAKLPPAARQIADSVNSGSMSLGDFRKAIKGLPEDQANLLNQWRNMHDRASGFNQILKGGGNDVQTYTAALAKATGDASSLNVALQLTGENAGKTAEDIALISNTTRDADGSVKGWQETQQTFNTRLDQAKAAFGALIIQVGTMFLPTLTSMAHGLGTAAHWLGEHQGLVKALVVTLGAAGAAWAVYRTATALATAAMVAFDAAADANPIGLIVLALAALVAGIVYAYNHFGWFKTAVNTVWEWLKEFGHWIASTFGPIFRELAKVVGEVWTWIVDHVVKPYVAALKMEFKAVEVVVKWLWENVFRPYIHFIGDVIMWLWHNVLEPASEAIGWIFRTIGALIKFAWETLIKPVFDAWGAIFLWLWHNVIEPAVEGFKVAWHAAGVAWQELHDHVIKPVSDKIGTIFNAVKEFAKDMVAGIKAEWDKIKGIVSEPVRFIVETVYDKGIAAVYNKIADVFGGPHLPELKFEGFAGGGILPGYSPGRDNMLGRLPSGRVVGLSGGEGILVPELARALGPEVINRANHAASGRRPGGRRMGFDGGGILDDIGNAVSGAVDIATDPVGALRHAVDAFMGQLPGDANTAWIQTIKGLPGKLIDMLASVVGLGSGGQPGALGPGGGGNPAVPVDKGAMVAIAQREYAAAGLPPGEWDDYVRLENSEAGFNPTAKNPSSTAYGVGQFLDSTWAGFGPKTSDPTLQFRYMMAYLKQRYHGSPSEAWRFHQANNWYGGGGIIGYDAGTPSVDDEDSFSGYGNLGPDAAAGAASAAAESPYTGSTGVLQVIYDDLKTGAKIGAAAGQRVGPGTNQPNYYQADWSGHTGHVHTAFATSPDGKPYGLPKGTDIRQGGAGFPPWVYTLGARYGLEPSTYPGHQEASGRNRGIDWWPRGHADMSGASYTEEERSRLRKFAADMARMGQGQPGGGSPAAWGSGSVNMTAAGGTGGTGGTGSRGALNSATGGETGAEASGGGMTGTGILTGMGNTKNWTVRGIAEYVGAMLANFALGNPVGAIAASKQGGTAGTSAGTSAGVTAAGQAVDATNPAAAANVDATTAATAAYNGENAKTLKFKAEIAAANERIEKAEAHLREMQAKHPAGGTQVEQAQHSLDLANQAKSNLEERIRQSGENASVQAAIDADRVAGQNARGKPSPTSQRALQGQQDTVAAAGAVGLGPNGAPLPGTGAGASAGVTSPLPPQIGPSGVGGPGGGPGPGGISAGGIGLPQGLPGVPGSPVISPSSFNGPAAAAGAAADARPSSVSPATRVGGTGPGFSSTIASTALGALGPLGAAGQPAAKLADRTIGYMGQLAGIAASGVMETFLPSGVGDKLADPGKSWFGKLALGIAGAHSDQPNRAGASGPPITPPADPAAQAAGKPAAPVMPDQAGQGPGGKGPGGGDGQAPLIGEMNITQQQPVDGGAVGRDINRYAGGLTR